MQDERINLYTQELVYLYEITYGNKIKNPSPYKFQDSSLFKKRKFYPLVHPMLSQFPLTTDLYRGASVWLNDQEVLQLELSKISII